MILDHFFYEAKSHQQWINTGIEGDWKSEFPIVKDTTPNITNSRLNNIP